MLGATKTTGSRTLRPLPATQWLGSYKHARRAVSRIFLFYGAGTDSSLFTDWQKIVDKSYPQIELCIVEYPGHGQHQGDFHTSTKRLVYDFLEPICSTQGLLASWFRCPYVIVGTSLGACVAYEFMQEMVRAGLPPLKFYVVASTARTLPDMELVDKFPKDTLELIQFCLDKCVPSRAEIMSGLLERMEKSHTKQMERTWRADLTMASKRFLPLPIRWQVCHEEGKLIKRVSPEDQNIYACTRAPGSFVHTTGREFVGLSGGHWVEIDPTKDEKPGWLLTHGRTVGMDRDLLVEAEEEGRPMDSGDLFWKIPCPVTVHWSTADKRCPFDGVPGKKPPIKEWTKLSQKEPEYVMWEGLQHDELLRSTGVFEWVLKDLEKVFGVHKFPDIFAELK